MKTGRMSVACDLAAGRGTRVSSCARAARGGRGGRTDRLDDGRHLVELLGADVGAVGEAELRGREGGGMSEGPVDECREGGGTHVDHAPLADEVLVREGLAVLVGEGERAADLWPADARGGVLHALALADLLLLVVEVEVEADAGGEEESAGLEGEGLSMQRERGSGRGGGARGEGRTGGESDARRPGSGSVLRVRLPGSRWPRCRAEARVQEAESGAMMREEEEEEEEGSSKGGRPTGEGREGCGQRCERACCRAA